MPTSTTTTLFSAWGWYANNTTLTLKSTLWKHILSFLEALGGRSQFLPSMIDMCTALRRVRGTLLRRGPCVMDGQLLLGTRPALQRQTQTKMHKHHWTEKQHRADVILQRVRAADIKTSTVAWCLRKWRKKINTQKHNLIESILTSPEFTYNSTCVFLEVRVWFWHSAPSPLLPLVHCYKAQRWCSGWVSHTRTQTYNQATWCHPMPWELSLQWMNTVHENHDWINLVNSTLCSWITTSETNAHRRAGKKYQNNGHGLPFITKLNNNSLTWL